MNQRWNLPNWQTDGQMEVLDFDGSEVDFFMV